MKRLKVLGRLIMAVSLLNATVAVSSASAAEMKNAEFQIASNGKSVSASRTLFGTFWAIGCQGDQATTTAANKKEGTITIDFLKCTFEDEECDSLGDTGGKILASGTYLLVLLDIVGKDQLGIVITFKHLHIECKFFVSLAVLEGGVIGSIEARAGTKKEFSIKIRAKGATEQEFKEYLNEREEKVKDVPLCSLDEGTNAECGQEAGEEILSTEKETELIN